MIFRVFTGASAEPEDTLSIAGSLESSCRRANEKVMSPEEVTERFLPAIEEMVNRCRIADEFVDKEQFQVLIATVWGNAVLEPERSGIEESDLESLHQFLNDHIEQVVGPGETVTSCYEFIVSKKGEESLVRQQVSANHKEFLLYFARLILQDFRPVE